MLPVDAPYPFEVQFYISLDHLKKIHIDIE